MSPPLPIPAPWDLPVPIVPCPSCLHLPQSHFGGRMGDVGADHPWTLSHRTPGVMVVGGYGAGFGVPAMGTGQLSHPTAPLPDKPTAKIEPHPQYPREGEKLQLQCDGQGNPV